MQRYNFPTEPLADPESIVGGGDKPYRFTILTDGLVRFEYAADCVFEDRASTFATFRKLPVPKFRVIDTGKHLEILTKRFHLFYDKKEFSANGLRVQVLGNVTDWKSVWLYGAHQYDGEFNLRGTARTLDEADGRIPLEYGVIAKNGFAMIDDSESMLFTKENWISGRRQPKDGKIIDGYLFAYGLDYKAAIKAFYMVSGHQPLVPRWALGNWWSRYYKYSDKEYLELIDRFREEGIPLSVGVLDMEWHWVADERVEDSSFSGWTGYSWDTKMFPKPKEFLEELHKRKIVVTPNDHPADGIAPYEECYEEICKALGYDSKVGDAVSFDPASKDFVDAYFDIALKKLEDDGIDFWWVDWQQGPYSRVAGVDPLWVLNHFHFLNNMRGNKRPLTFSRFAGPGSHRYPVGFSGDTVVTWESLNFQPEFTATSSNIGYGWWSHDIGGHMEGYRDDELATRWVQLGVFSPILRLHSSNNPWNSKEPWRFPMEERKIQNEALRLRHQLVPYVYTMNRRSAVHDEPLVQPIYWEYPKRVEAYDNKNTFFFGSELLVCAITSPRHKVTRRGKARAWLPPGRHVDIFSGVVYDGNREIYLHRTLEQYAVFAHEGSIIPMDAAAQPENGCVNPSAMQVMVAVGADGDFDMYEDDGKGSHAEDVEWIVTPMKYDQSSGTLTVGPASIKSSAVPDKRSWTFTFPALDPSTRFTVSVDGTDLAHEDVHTETLAYAVKVSIPPTSTAVKVTVKLDVQNPQLRVTDPKPHMFALLDHAQMPYDPKQPIWKTVSDDKLPLGMKITTLQAYDLADIELVGAMIEFLCADSRGA